MNFGNEVPKFVLHFAKSMCKVSNRLLLVLMHGVIGVDASFKNVV